MRDWIKNHFQTLFDLQLNTLTTALSGDAMPLETAYAAAIDLLTHVRQADNKIMFIGNGGSAGICSHLAIDFSKNGRMRACAFSDAAALTCLSNDYGYDHVYEKQVEYHARPGDVLIAISSSGKSTNILNGVHAARRRQCKVITFSGFDLSNPLRTLGDVNFFVDSPEYGFVEVAHVALGHSVLDYILQQDQCVQDHVIQPLAAGE